MAFADLWRGPGAALALAACVLMSPLAQASFNPWEGVQVIDEDFTATADGVTRHINYLRPPHVAAGAPAIVMLHYNDGNAQAMANLTDAGELARDFGVWVIMPIAAGGKWGINPNNPRNNDDVGFLSELIDHAVATYGIDAHRVYMTGYSQGGNMAVRFACEQPLKIAAVSAVASTMLTSLSNQCTPPAPTPMMFVDGTADQQVPYDGTVVGDCVVTNLCSISAPAAAQFWAAADGCPTTPTSSEAVDTVDDGTDIKIDHYGNCTSGARVDLYTVNNGGHTWPGAIDFTPRLGLTSQDIQAGPRMWSYFFSQFSR
ncbi:MAG TPA: PHB depolymerase family esterase [Nevskiaceae bacterium]|nr:PHB depolymerase family esterase [Nevskiaceae bacterium]